MNVIVRTVMLTALAGGGTLIGLVAVGEVTSRLLLRYMGKRVRRGGHDVADMACRHHGHHDIRGIDLTARCGVCRHG